MAGGSNEIRKNCLLDCWASGDFWSSRLFTFCLTSSARKIRQLSRIPASYYGFVGCALAWQIAFCFMATDPVRYRPLMIPSILEKATYAIAIVALVSQGRTNPRDLLFASTDSLLGLLFVIAYFKTKSS